MRQITCLIMISTGMGYQSDCLSLWNISLGRKFWDRVRCQLTVGLHQAYQHYKCRHKVKIYFFFSSKKKETLLNSGILVIHSFSHRHVTERASFCYNNVNHARVQKSQDTVFQEIVFFCASHWFWRKSLSLNISKGWDFARVSPNWSLAFWMLIETCKL